MQNQKIIEQLGYTPNEAKVYLAALGLGACHVSDIALKTKLPRTSVQVMVDRLHRDGLMNFYVQRRYKFWVAENPERLLEQLRLREEEIKAALPKLNALRKGGSEAVHKSEIKIFKGQDEARLVLDDIITTKRHILGIIPQDNHISFFYEMPAWSHFLESCARNYLRLSLLVPDTELGASIVGKHSGNSVNARFLPQGMDLQTAIFIYGNKVSFFLLSNHQLTSVTIEDEGMSDTNTALFNELSRQGRGRDGGHHSLKTENLFRILSDASPQPLLIANENTDIEYVNAAWGRQFGYTLDEVRGSNPRMFQSSKTPRRVFEQMWESLSQGRAFQSDEIIDKRKDGTFFNLLTTIFPVESNGRRYYVQILDDITKRERAESLRSEFMEAAKEADGPVRVTKGELMQLERLVKKLLEGSS